MVSDHPFDGGGIERSSASQKGSEQLPIDTVLRASTSAAVLYWPGW